MRIACIHIPQFALQCVTRSDPGLLRERPAVAVVTPHQRHAPVVTACSRAAWAVGVRPGMAAAAAHALSSELVVVPADAASERELVRALADVLLALSPVVDVGRRVGANETHLALYAEVPSKMRGSSFGERVLERLTAFGVTARIGIADDRFTAWVAAISEHEADGDSCIASVPRGGSAAFLAPRSLSLLALSPEVQHMLESLGVATLGEFAALPAPSHAVVRPFEPDYRALARGESGHALRPYAPEAPIREEVALRHTSAPAAVALLAERVFLRLAGRARGAARIEVMASGEGGEWLMPVSLADGTTAEQLADAIGAALADHPHPSPWRLRVVVTGERLLGEPEAVTAEEPVAPSARTSTPVPVDALAVVLSSTGAFGLRAERRALHRGTRRSKAQRNHRRSANAQAELVQARLFKS